MPNVERPIEDGAQREINRSTVGCVQFNPCLCKPQSLLFLPPLETPFFRMSHLPPFAFLAFLVFLASWTLAPPLAQAQPAVPLEAVDSTKTIFHPWEVPTPRLKSEAYFTNLADDDKIETPFLLKFGLSGGWGLAPIAKAAAGKSGHHHLLVNRDLPLNFKEALPFNDQYIHFGGGQMETVLTFGPGIYTLRMLLADQQHLPHFVYSKPVTITVTKKNPTDPKSLQTTGISLMLPESSVRPPFRVQFHASGLNVAHQSQQIPGSGHFRLVGSDGRETADMAVVNGQTEVYLSPPPGNYNLQLFWVSNRAPSGASIEPVSAQITVR